LFVPQILLSLNQTAVGSHFSGGVGGVDKEKNNCMSKDGHEIFQRVVTQVRIYKNNARPRRGMAESPKEMAAVSPPNFWDYHVP
jgi:hypothetical protein